MELDISCHGLRSRAQNKCTYGERAYFDVGVMNVAANALAPILIVRLIMGRKNKVHSDNGSP